METLVVSSTPALTKKKPGNTLLPITNHIEIMKYIIGIAMASCLLLLVNPASAQGPPITSDKPIMLGQGAWVAKTLTEVNVSQQGAYTYAPIMVHFIVKPDILLGIHAPFTHFNFEDDEGNGKEASFGDLRILGKYQFVRKDQKGKTFRMVAKTLQTLPTGQNRVFAGERLGEYSGYYGIVAGYEYIKYGISSELGYQWVPNTQNDALRVKLGFGLPFLKPTYPVNQLNLYFEYASNWEPETGNYRMLYAQGIQYAKKQLTVEASVRLPLVQNVPDGMEYRYGILLGARYIF